MEIFIIIFIPILFLLFNIFLYFAKKEQYENTSYYSETQTPYIEMVTNSGIRGEYSVFNIIKEFARINEQYLFNLYIPTYQNKTTEIDIIMITSQGIFVIECKNYSGWIFGNEIHSKWTQSLYVGYGQTKKYHFYNPIMQNDYHIKYLKRILHTNVNFFSIVVFSDNCTLKKITRKQNSQAHLVNLKDLYSTIQNIRDTVSNNILTNEEISRIYQTLYPYAHVNQQTKINHIHNLKFK